MCSIIQFIIPNKSRESYCSNVSNGQCDKFGWLSRDITINIIEFETDDFEGDIIALPRSLTCNISYNTLIILLTIKGFGKMECNFCEQKKGKKSWKINI